MLPASDAPVATASEAAGVTLLAVGIVGICVVPLILLMGFFTIQPNQARVLILLGDYKGTVREEGFHWANPFYSRSAGSTVDARTGKSTPLSTKVSLRARTYNGEHLKVNDKCGNPIEIADVIVWRVENTAQALFDVDDYNSYVHTQSETALRHVATTYAYDQMPGAAEGEITLRSNIEEVSAALKEELVDVLHFFVSLCLRSGMDAEELYARYLDKNRENFDRQYGRSARKGYEVEEHG